MPGQGMAVGGAFERPKTMDWHNKGLRKGCGLAGIVLLMISLFTFDLNDPSLTNLRYPMHGISNLAGLPGALVGGSLVEFLGTSSLWIPALLANWMLIPSRHRQLGATLLYGGSLILFSASLHGLLAKDIIPSLTAPGLVGIAGSRWMLRATSATVAVPLLFSGLIFALSLLLRLPLLGAALRELSLISAYLRRMALARVAARWARLKQGSWKIRQWVASRLGGLPRRAGKAGQPRLSKEAAPGKPNPGQNARNTDSRIIGGAGRAAVPPADQGIGAQDGFSAWISAVGKPPEGTGTAEKS